MLETQEDIDYALELAGETLIFASETIRGIPGQIDGNVHSFDSPYDVYKQIIDFKISYKDFETLSIGEDTEFTYVTPWFKMLFRVTSYSNDLTGWVNLVVSFKDILNV